MRAVLGVNVNPGHDTGAAVVVERDGRVQVTAISQERLDRVKHSRAFPREAIDYCLREAGCRLQDVDLVVATYILTPSPYDGFPGRPIPELERKVEFFRQVEELGIPVLFADHHLCHAASAYFSTDWDGAVGLVIDGHGSNFETQSVFSCEGRAITKLCASNRPGLGWMYSATTERLLGFDHLQEGKTMGLAGWTDHGGVFAGHFAASTQDAGPMDTLYPQFVGEQSAAGWTLDAPADLPRRRSKDDPTLPPFAQFAFAAQSELERGVMQLVEYASRLNPGKRRLCYAGGVALNIPANRLILDSGLFEEIFIQPAATDPGLPLGAALLGYYSALGGAVRWRMDHAFLARPYDSGEGEAAAARWSGPRARYQTADLARVLDNDYLVAWFQGASEFGPRALGHRSILCCPRHPQMKAYLNREVKHREMFRPFAPIVPMERQAEFFDLAAPSPYMLINAAVRPEHAARMPAVVHADGTARVQSIDRTVNPELHALLQAMAERNGLPVLLNTSLNLAGEPIVETPADALSLFERARLDVLVIGGHILSKKPLLELMNSRNPGLPRLTSPSGAAVVNTPAIPSRTAPVAGGEAVYATAGNLAHAASAPVNDPFSQLEAAIAATSPELTVEPQALRAFHAWCRETLAAQKVPVNPQKILAETEARPVAQSIALTELLLALGHDDVAAEVSAILFGLHPADRRVQETFLRASYCRRTGAAVDRADAELHGAEPAAGTEPSPAASRPAPSHASDAVSMHGVLERLVDRICGAQVDPRPSGNFYVEDVFPDPLYREILSRLPADDRYDFIEHPDAVLPDGTKTRKLLDLGPHTLARLEARDQAFWRELMAILVSERLQQAILEKFADRIVERFGTHRPPLVTVPILYRDFPGYRIGVHTDAPYKVATMQFYLPRDDSQLHLGTSFYFRTAEGFQKYKTNVFKPNSAYAFVRTEESWHGVERMAMGESPRDTLALTIYVKGREYRSDGGTM